MPHLPPAHPHPNPLRTLTPQLLPHLPHTLPLLRRIAFHTSPPTAHTLSTFPPTPTSTPPSSFAATYVDRSRAPETECWIFSTYERLPQAQQDEPARKDEARRQLLALLNAIARLPNGPNAKQSPLLVLGTLNECLLPLLAGRDLEHLLPQPVVSRNIDVARASYHGKRRPSERKEDEEEEGGGGGVIASLSVPYQKWFIAPPPSSLPLYTPKGKEKSALLPPNYTFSTVHKNELPILIARTSIPRTVATLADLCSVAVRYYANNNPAASPSSTSSSPSQKTKPEEEGEQQRGQLVAWAFLATDGSLKSLHVEAEHRGQGLAKAVSRRLLAALAEDSGAVGFRDVVDGGGGGGGDGNGNGDGEEGKGKHNGDEGWACSDVAVDNVESAGVARGLGGREGWRVRWVSVDLGMVETVVGRVGEEAGGG